MAKTDWFEREWEPPMLALAAIAGDAGLASDLLDSGVDPNARDRDGLTALHHAAESGCAVMVAVLLDGGADPNALDGGGRTPLHAAAAAGADDVISVLMESGADPAIRDSAGFAPGDLAEAHVIAEEWRSARIHPG